MYSIRDGAFEEMTRKPNDAWVTRLGLCAELTLSSGSDVTLLPQSSDALAGYDCVVVFCARTHGLGSSFILLRNLAVSAFTCSGMSF